MAITKPAVRTAWADGAGGSDLTDPGNTFVAAGWPSSSTPPARQYFNWILNYCANAVRYFSRRGLVDYDAAETYSAGDIVRGDNGLMYQSLQNANTGNTPSVSGSWWGSVSTPTPSATDNSSRIATTAFVGGAVSSEASARATAISTEASARATADALRLPLTGGTLTGPLTVDGGDITAYRAGGTTGVIFLRSDNGAYVYYDGANYQMPNGNVITGGGQLANVNQVSAAQTNAENYAASLIVSDFSASFGPVGYKNLANGFILQWGQYRGGGSYTGANGFVAWFPTTFPNAVLAINATPSGTTVNGNADCYMACQRISNSQFSLYARDVNNQTFAANFDWIAVGY